MEAGTFRHYVNGIQVEDPEGWVDFKEDLERDFRDRLISSKFPLQMKFHSGGYALLRQAFEEDYCIVYPYRCEQFCDGAWNDVALGTIIIADIEWNLNRCTAEVSIQDDGAGARIKNNKDILVFPTATLTKNSEDLAPVPALTAFSISDPTLANTTTDRVAFDWYACLQHLVLFITDNKVSVVSDWYDDLPDDERYAVMLGVELRTHNANHRAPSFNFTDLFLALAIPYDLWASVERDNAGNPRIRIEPQERFFGVDPVVSYPNTDNVIEAIDTKLLYQKVVVDSEAAIKNENADFGYSLPYVGLRSFAKEEFFLAGSCNTEEVLSLINPFITDSNAIEDAYMNNNPDNDEGVFILQYDQSNNTVVQTDYLNPGFDPYLYNEQLLNINILNRYKLPASGVSYYADQDAQFQASQSVAGIVYTLTGWAGDSTGDIQQQFSDDYTPPDHDTDNNYGNGTTQGNPVSQADSLYTAPQQGYYQFTTSIGWRILSNIAFDTGMTNPDPCKMRLALNIRARKYNSANVLQSTQSKFQSFQTSTQHYAPGIYSEEFTFGMPMQLGDYVLIQFVIDGEVPLGCAQFNGFTPIDYTATAQIILGLFKSNFTAVGGGQLDPQDPNAYYSTTLKFDRHIPVGTWMNLKRDLSAIVQVGEGPALRDGYVRKVSRRLRDGATEWELIANRLTSK